MKRFFLVAILAAVASGRYRIVHTEQSLVVPATPPAIPVIAAVAKRGGPIAAHPECRWACDDPLDTAVCRPVCHPPVCNYTCDPGPSYLNCEPPKCHIRCPADQYESITCPSCEVVCQPLSCFPYRHPCGILCEAPQCNWECRKPLNSPKPQCQQVCERPACELPTEPLAYTPVYPGHSRSSNDPVFSVHARLQTRLIK